MPGLERVFRCEGVELESSLYFFVFIFLSLLAYGHSGKECGLSLELLFLAHDLG